MKPVHAAALRERWRDPQFRERALGGKPDNWPPERVEELIRLFPTNTIDTLAERFGMSRGAIQGKTSRLGLSKGRPDRRRGPNPPKAIITTHVVAFKPKPVTKTRLEIIMEMPLSATQTCQFIEADPKVDPTKCGQPAIEGKPYCPHHHARCFVQHVPKVHREAA